MDDASRGLFPTLEVRSSIDGRPRSPGLASLDLIQPRKTIRTTTQFAESRVHDPPKSRAALPGRSGTVWAFLRAIIPSGNPTSLVHQGSPNFAQSIQLGSASKARTA